MGHIKGIPQHAQHCLKIPRCTSVKGAREMCCSETANGGQLCGTLSAPGSERKTIPTDSIPRNIAATHQEEQKLQLRREKPLEHIIVFNFLECQLAASP